MTLFRVAFTVSALLLTPISANAQGQIGSGHVIGNPSAAQRTPTDSSVTAIFDRALGSSTQGSMISRTASAWAAYPPTKLATFLGAAYGIVCDGSTDDYPGMLAAATAAAAAGGGNIIMPSASNSGCRQSQGLTINAPVYFVSAQGVGAAAHAGASTAACKITWTGSAGGTMLTYSAVSGAGNNRLSGGGFIGCGLFGGGVAAVGIAVASQTDGIYRFYGEHFTTACMTMNVVASLVETRSTQHNDITLYCNQPSTGDGSLIVLGGDATANTSFNKLDIQGVYFNAIGIDIGNTDNNTFRQIRITQNGGGSATIGVVLRANASAIVTARNNLFLHVSPGARPMNIQGTDTATFPAVNNKVIWYDIANSVAPTFGTGAKLTWANNSTMDETFSSNLIIPNAKAYQGVDPSGNVRDLLLRFSDDITYVNGGAGSGGLKLRVNNGATDGLYIVASGVITFSQYTAGALSSNGSGVISASTLSAANGGTGLSTFAVGDLIYASATTPTLSKLAAVATGSVLVSAGVNTAPAYSSTPTLSRLALSNAAAGTTIFQGVGIGASFIVDFNANGNTYFDQAVMNWRAYDATVGMQYVAPVSGSLAAGGISILHTNDATALSTGSLQTAGGGAFAKSVWAGGNFQIATAAKTLVLKQGANGSVGTFVCTGGGTITISNTNIAITDAIVISLNTLGGTITTAPATKAITASTSFQVLCGATDTSTYNYALIKNAAWLLDPANDNRPMFSNSEAA